jgi:hypothetical protein
MNRTEEQIEKDHKITRQYFFHTNTPRSIDLIKMTLVIEAIANVHNIDTIKDDVINYAIKNHLIHGTDEEIKKQLQENNQQYDLIRIATRNEKTLEFVYNTFLERNEV